MFVGKKVPDYFGELKSVGKEKKKELRGLAGDCAWETDINNVLIQGAIEEKFDWLNTFFCNIKDTVNSYIS